MDQLPQFGKRELICLLLFTCNYVVSFRRGLIPLGAWDGLRYFIVALSEPSILLFCFKFMVNSGRHLGRSIIRLTLFMCVPNISCESILRVC